MDENIIGRRRMLRGLLGGAAVAVGLPPLEAMLNTHGTAWADGSAIPRRFGQWFFGNGVRLAHWVPATTGTAWQAAPPASLQPFAQAGVLPYVSVVTRAWMPFDSEIAHHSSYWGQMTSSEPLGANGVPTTDGGGYPNHGAGPRAIDVIADALSPGTKVERVKASISRGAAGGDHLSGDVQSSEYNPQALYDLLFSDFSPDNQTPPPGLIDARRSVLDAVAADASALRTRLGVNDRARLDQHLDSIAAIEASLGNVTAACMLPADPGPRPADLPGNGEQLDEINEAMSSLIAYAWACDLSRVFEVMFSRLQAYTYFWQVGIDVGHHQLSHDEPGDQPLMQAATVYTMERLAVLLGKLAAIPVGDDNLLDHCCIWATSEHNEGNQHGTFDIPNLVIGRAGGALRGGVHHDAGGNGDWHHRLDEPGALHGCMLLTMMQALGMDVGSFGVGIGECSQTMTPLLA